MSVHHIEDEEDYERQLTTAGSKLVVVDFSAEWCGPCKMIAPIFESLSKKYKGSAVFLKVDVDSCQEVAASCNIKAMPTFIFYKSKTEVHRIRGADSSALELKVKELADSSCGFSGSGQRLGGDVENSGGTEGSTFAGLTSWLPGVPSLLTGLISGTGPSTTPDNLKNNNEADNEAAAQNAMAVDNSSPVATIQLRLADGSKLTLKINTNKSVSKIREFVCIARPSLSSRPFSLLTTFPSKEITNEDATILEAKLANSVVVLKHK